MEHNSEQNSVVQQDDGSGKHFVLEDFDGPLDVLLFLIKKHIVHSLLTF